MGHNNFNSDQAFLFPNKFEVMKIFLWLIFLSFFNRRSMLSFLINFENFKFNQENCR